MIDWGKDLERKTTMVKCHPQHITSWWHLSIRLSLLALTWMSWLRVSAGLFHAAFVVPHAPSHLVLSEGSPSLRGRLTLHHVWEGLSTESTGNSVEQMPLHIIHSIYHLSMVFTVCSGSLSKAMYLISCLHCSHFCHWKLLSWPRIPGTQSTLLIPSCQC